jgi:two-component system chemotaxis response regulator CheY
VAGKVLVLDADDTALVATRNALEAAGYEVPILRTPFLLFEALHEEKPDVLLLEINVPQIRGDKILEVLNGFAAVEGVTVLFHSTLPEAEGLTVARAAGAFGYVPKGEGDARLVARIEEAVLRANTERLRGQLT